MRITNLDARVFDEALSCDEPRLTIAGLRTLESSEDVVDDGPDLRRLVEYPEELAPSFQYELD